MNDIHKPFGILSSARRLRSGAEEWYSKTFPVRFDKIRSLRELSTKISTVCLEHDLRDVPGWLRPNERKALYAVARWAPGPFLEIGSWVGLSTSYIAYGIRDSRVIKPFLAAELNPHIENYRPYDVGIGFFVPPDAEVPHGVCSHDLFEREIKPVVTAPGGVIGQLRSNLARFGLLELVEIYEGDFREMPQRTFRFIFLDIMHDLEEITNNAPGIRRFIAPGTIMACHDTDESNEKCIKQQFDFSFAFRVDSLFIGEIRG